MDRLNRKHGCQVWFVVACLVTVAANVVYSQTTISGNALTMRSNGFSGFSGDWTLTDNGFVGTYIHLSQPGTVTLSADAFGSSSGGIDPRMNLVVADHSVGWDVSGSANTYQTSLELPAGTHLVRAEFNNDAEQSNRSLTLSDLTVSGASVLNSNTDANALDAANTYIEKFRKGLVSVGLSGLAPGTEVGVSLKRHAFNFGTAVAGGNFSTILDSNPAPGSDAFNYQENLKNLFNAAVPENAGKWSNNEFTQDSVWHPHLDRIRDFAAANNMRLRGHNVIWGDQQPGWVNTLISQASGGNQSAINELRQEITERIGYYVGDGIGNEPANQIIELDVYNETFHTPEYWDIFGPQGVADIYNEVRDAVAAAGATTQLYMNEYNVLQDSGDFYGNWYRENIEEIIAEGGAVSGVGIQSYENDPNNTWSGGLHDASRKAQTFQNLSVLGLPLTLTEFGVKDPTGQADATTMLDETARLVFGTPQAEGFFMWGFWRGDIFRGAAALFDQNWNLTQAGNRWLDLFSIDEDGDPNDDWDTQLLATVGENGIIEFDGFWGDYELTIGGNSYDLELVKGALDYSLAIVPGDYDANGVVDSADYTVWLSTLGATDDLRADGDGSGTIDEADYDIWKSSFGTLASSTVQGNVPEPSTFLCGLFSVLLLAFKRTRRSS